MGDALLKPEDSGVDGDGGIGYGRNVFGATEDVHDVNGFGDVFEARIGFLTEDFPFVGIDGNDYVAGGLKVGGDFVRGTGGIGGQADDGDGFGGAEYLRDGIGRWSGVGWEMEFHGRRQY